MLQTTATKKVAEMIVVVNMKNIILRGKTYYFRIGVPADCREELKQREIVESLRTRNPLAADERAESSHLGR